MDFQSSKPTKDTDVVVFCLEERFGTGHLEAATNKKWFKRASRQNKMNGKRWECKSGLENVGIRSTMGSTK